MTELNHAPSVNGSSEITDAWTVILLTCRNEETDFRLPLAEELAGLGYDVSYIFLKRRPKITDMKSKMSRTVSFAETFSFIRMKKKSSRKLLVINSTNLAFPLASIALKTLIGGYWCMDIHDDLLYNSRGVRRVISSIKLQLLLAGSDFSVHAAPALGEIFPHSRHLGNASNIVPVMRDNNNHSGLLILASMDERFDFEFVSQLSSDIPDIKIDIYGSISKSDKETNEKIEKLLFECENVKYKGAYKNDDISSILGKYSVTIAPYKLDNTTRYIDPLRYYHCLNSGMEVISTKVPQAKFLSGALHLVDSSGQAKAIIVGLSSETVSKRNDVTFHRENNWKKRAERLIEIATIATQQK